MAPKALCGLASATLPFVYYIPATMAFLLYSDSMKLFPASGPLHLLFPMLGHSESWFFHKTSLSPHVNSSEGLSPDSLKWLLLYYHLCPIVLSFFHSYYHYMNLSCLFTGSLSVSSSPIHAPPRMEVHWSYSPLPLVPSMVAGIE